MDFFPMISFDDTVACNRTVTGNNGNDDNRAEVIRSRRLLDSVNKLLVK